MMPSISINLYLLLVERGDRWYNRYALAQGSLQPFEVARDGIYQFVERNRELKCLVEILRGHLPFVGGNQPSNEAIKQKHKSPASRNYL